MTPEELRERIVRWAIGVGALVDPLFNRLATCDRARQLKRSADSAAANYRAACFARSHRAFVAKLSIALEETDESVGWLEMSGREGVLSGVEFDRLLDEARQLARILARSRITAEANERRARSTPRLRQ